MPNSFLPEHYKKLQEKYGEFMEAVENLGVIATRQGPIDAKNANLIQLAAAVGVKAEGAVHSHTRRAVEAGATPDEIRHAVILLTSTLGFPAVAMALAWVQDVLQEA
jgi:4-carboxymuconolactone decarboxylase